MQWSRGRILCWEACLSCRRTSRSARCRPVPRSFSPLSTQADPNHSPPLVLQPASPVGLDCCVRVVVPWPGARVGAWRSAAAAIGGDCFYCRGHGGAATRQWRCHATHRWQQRNRRAVKPREPEPEQRVKFGLAGSAGGAKGVNSESPPHHGVLPVAVAVSGRQDAAAARTARQTPLPGGLRPME